MAAPPRGREPRAREPPQGRAGARSAGRRRRPRRDRTGARAGRRRVRVRRRAVPQGRVAADAGHPFGGDRRRARRSERRRGSGRERARGGADRFARGSSRRRRSPTSLGSSRARGTLPRSISGDRSPPRRRRSTSPRCADRRRPVERSRWRPPVGTTSSWSDRPAPARRCSPAAWPRSCRSSRAKRRSRRRSCTPSPGS